MASKKEKRGICVRSQGPRTIEKASPFIQHTTTNPSVSIVKLPLNDA